MKVGAEHPTNGGCHFFLYLIIHYCYLIAYKFSMTSISDRRIWCGVKKILFTLNKMWIFLKTKAQTLRFNFIFNQLTMSIWGGIG